MVQRGVNLGYSDISEINIDLDGLSIELHCVLSHCCCTSFLLLGGEGCRVQCMHQAEAFEATDTTRLRRCNNDVTDVLAVRTIMSSISFTWGIGMYTVC